MLSIPAESLESRLAQRQPRVAPMRRRVSVWGRLLAIALAAACLTVLIIAAKLQPSRDGVGSHREMGLQPCQLMERTGVPCTPPAQNT